MPFEIEHIFSCSNLFPLLVRASRVIFPGVRRPVLPIPLPVPASLDLQFSPQILPSEEALQCRSQVLPRSTSTSPFSPFSESLLIRPYLARIPASKRTSNFVHFSPRAREAKTVLTPTPKSFRAFLPPPVYPGNSFRDPPTFCMGIGE